VTYELLLSADMMVADPDATAAMLVDRLGVHGRPSWRQAFPGHPYIAHFLRAHRSLAVSPTRLEPQGHLDLPNPGDPPFREHLHSLLAFQGVHRPVVTHSTVLIVDDLGPIAQRLHDRRQPFRLAQRTPEMPWDRLWVGVTTQDPHYRPTVDGGLCIEIMESWPLQLPPETYDVPPPSPRDPEPADLVRVTARGYLVEDLDDTLRLLDDNLDLRPGGPVEELTTEGLRRARFGFSIGHSATLDVIEATRWDSDAGRFAHTWGPGPWYARLSAVDLAAKAGDLAERGTRFTWVEQSEAVGGRPLIRIDPSSLGGLVVEIEEHPPA
jgi:hypothetical protein